MARNKNKLVERLASISTAKPVDCANIPIVKRDAHIERSERQTTYRFASLLQEGGEKISCILKNISKTGVKVMIEGDKTLPQKMTLWIDAICMKKNVRLIWQDQETLGLAFEDETDDANAGTSIDAKAPPEKLK